MAAIISFKNLFRTREKSLSFKNFHFLNSIPTDRLEEILLFSEGDHINFLWPSFEGKKVLFFNDQKHRYILRKLMTEEPSYFVNYVYRGEATLEQRESHFTVLGDLDRIALRRGHFDIVVSPLALENFSTFQTFVRNISSYMDNGSRLIISIKHPNLDNILYNQNPSATHTMETTVAKYYATLKENHLFTEDMREGTVDLPLKAFFSDGEIDYYHEYKNTPMTLMFRAVKFQKKI